MEDPRLGRFISLDPTSKYTSSLLLFFDPQRFNTYSYANNNPIKYTDPDGNQAVEVVKTFQKLLPYIAAGLGFLATQNEKLIKVEKAILKETGEAVAETAKEAGNAILEGVKMGYETAKDLANGDGFAGPAQQSSTQSESSSTPAPADPGGNGPKKDDGKNDADDVMKTNKGEMKLSKHALEKRMPGREITKKQAIETINKNDPFKYFHDNQWKTGFYDKVTKIFVGKGEQITTVMKNVKESYIEGLKNIKP